MSYLSVPTRGSLFQNDKVSQKITNWKKLTEIKRVQKAEEYLNRHLRESRIDDDDHVVLNIGGTIFKTRKATLRNVPGTKLSSLDESSSNYDKLLGQYYFDRNPFMFSFILDYYRTGSMHLPSKICSNLIREELKYWDLGDGCISECCSKSYFDELDANTTYELIKAEFYSLPTYSEKTSDTNFTNNKWQKFKTKAWVFIDNHESSLLAKVFAVIYYGLILTSILNLFASTLPAVRQPLKKNIFVRADHDAVPPTHYTKTLSNTTTIYLILTTDPPDFIILIDIFCLMFFTAEFIFRMVVCPSVRERFRSWYTVLDMLYLIPAWTRLIIDVSYPFYWQKGFKQATLLVFLDAMLVLRVFRIFRLSRHYRGFRVLLLAIKASMGEMTLLIVFVMLTLIIFASLIYCAEQYEHSANFDSIFKGLWWSLITLTTVGYGDTYPTGTVGRVIACFCAVSGLLIIGMVIPIIAGNFHLYYGFRQAGCETFGLYKPEFVPSKSENPPPDLDDDYGPMDRRLSLIPSESVMMPIRISAFSSKLNDGSKTPSSVGSTTNDNFVQPRLPAFSFRSKEVTPEPIDSNHSSSKSQSVLV